MSYDYIRRRNLGFNELSVPLFAYFLRVIFSEKTDDFFIMQFVFSGRGSVFTLIVDAGSN